MIINDALLSQLLLQASESPRRRQNLDLRTSGQDSSQRMLNALMPGTQVPIHRHCTSSETVVILKGSLEEIFFDEDGVETERFVLNRESGNIALQIPQGQWHTVVVKEPSVIFESKDGAYAPMASEDVR